MSLVVNHNLMAMNAARNLTEIYGRLSKSTERLSSGLRINSAADDAAGLAIRELMRADIRVYNQGIRNAADAISMIQTAEGALNVIDEKLVRMKELAEQAATGTYTTAQREIMDSEYQAMAAEIDRIANATEFNGVKLLDGSLHKFHEGSGMKIHFGTGNNKAEDYYFIDLGDMRATEATGLRVGNSDPKEIWRTTALNATSATAPLGQTAANGGMPGVFGLQYTEGIDHMGVPLPCGATPEWQMYGYVSVAPGCDSITDLVAEINRGSQASGWMNINTAATIGDLHNYSVTINGQIFTFDSSQTFSTAFYNGTRAVTTIGISGGDGTQAMHNLAAMLNANYSSTGVFAAINGTTVQLFAKEFGEGGNEINTVSGTTAISMEFEHLRNGGKKVLTADAWWNSETQEFELQITMDRGGDKNQLRIFTLTSLDTGGRIISDPLSSVGYLGFLPTTTDETTHVRNYGATDEDLEWWEAQNGSGNTAWDGADIRTQSNAQKALAALDEAINRKDVRRAELGAYANRLENTITNLRIQAENLQAAESRISDVDVATEMTEFTRNNILAQAATAMLAQANSLPQLALQLLGG